MWLNFDAFLCYLWSGLCVIDATGNNKKDKVNEMFETLKVMLKVSYRIEV